MIRAIYSNLPREERANVITHGLGLLLSLIGFPLLLYYGGGKAEQHHIAGLAVFGGSMLAVYLASTVYHCLLRETLKRVFRVIDHISIYFLIAGTHTPFLLYYMNNPTGRFYLIILWSLVLLGVLYKLFFFEKFEILSVIFYLGMGWMAVFTVPPMLDQISNATLGWIIAGGLSYSLGVIFFLWEKLPYNHAVWHLFVLGGTAGHFAAVMTMAVG
jgi:hemolysin III